MSTATASPATVLQEQINAAPDANAAREAIEQAAYAKHAAYRQYDGHWSGERWKLGVIDRRVRTRMGTAFERGDVVLYRDHEPHRDGTEAVHLTAYSVRNGVDTALRPSVRVRAFGTN